MLGIPTVIDPWWINLAIRSGSAVRAISGEMTTVGRGKRRAETW
jgi:hypothetical protein